MVKKEKIVLIGAGSLQFGLGAAGCILNSSILEGSTITLHDIDAKALDLAHQACQAAIEERKLDFTLESTTNRPDALKNATFIINSIEVAPRFDLWDQDYEIPRKFGNRQVFGENGGPGGMFHSLRVIPPILEICEDVMKICPNAFFLNFSNPMSRICLALKRRFPNLKAVGLCHEYYHHELIVSRILETPLSNLEMKAGGLNHFGILLDVKYKDTGKDAYPDIRKKGPNYLRSIETWDGHNIMIYILEKHGYLPYTTDSHYGEYIHWAWEIADMEGINRFKTGYMQSIEYESKKIARLIKRGKGANLVKPDDEKAIPIIEGILTDANYEEASVNLPNEGVITNLPKDLVVECPAIVNKKGLTPVKLGDFPKGFVGLLRNQATVQDLVVEAVLTGSKKIALQALLADPVVDSCSQAEKILNEMLRVQADYLHLE
ncbi:MAG: alpha-glucosidase [Candidatus Hermodarchaeota archaeon]